MAQNNWEGFWKDRKGKTVDMYPFNENFKIMKKIIERKFKMSTVGMKSLEIGSGRGIMSDFLHACGWDTYCVDKHYIPPDNGHNHKFFQCDVLDLPFDLEYFDLAFSYGLLEHFPEYAQQMILSTLRRRIKKDGLSLHYVVPEKLTNIFEDSNVYRDPCYYLRSQNATWVYPAIKCFDGQTWETYKWLAKGFWYEDTGVSYGKINKPESTEQE